MAALGALLAGCAPSAADRDANAAGIARAGGLAASAYRDPAFDLQLYRRDDHRPGPLFVYIEGDGAAYLDPRTPSADPTPIDPLTLRLAAGDGGPSVLYVGRPCQFAPGRDDGRCAVKDWTVQRFSPAIVGAIGRAIDVESAREPRHALVLVGYSGGGVIASLLAARRSDVALLVTLAAPLDTADWTQRVRLSPLTGSDSPVDHAADLASVPQIHFVGAKDTTVPVESTRSFVAMLGPGAPAALIVFDDFDHRCCWVEDWPRLRQRVLESAHAPALE